MVTTHCLTIREPLGLGHGANDDERSPVDGAAGK